MKRLLFALLVLIAVPASGAHAQEPVVIRVTPDSAVTQLTMRDGSTLVGRVLEVTPSTVRFLSSIGESVIPRTAIVSARESGNAQMRNGALWPEDPSRTRLLFAPTGRMMHAGEAYLTDAYVFFPSVQFGVTDKFSLGVGASIFPGIDITENILYFTPKLAVYQSPRVNLAIGALLAAGKVLSDVMPVGIGYGVATVGDENDSVTLGGGFGFAQGETASAGVVMLGGSSRRSKNIALVTENYLAVGDGMDGSILSGGVRFIGEKISVDAALWGGPSIEILVPYVAFIYRF